MQNGHVYGHPRLPSIGTILSNGVFAIVGSMNFHRSSTLGSDCGCCAALSWMTAMHVADGVGGVRRLRERADEQQVGLGEDLFGEVLETRVADEANVVAGLLAPDCHDLRHDAGE